MPQAPQSELGAAPQAPNLPRLFSKLAQCIIIVLQGSIQEMLLNSFPSSNPILLPKEGTHHDINNCTVSVFLGS